jgi:hypothetical protein
MIMAAHSNNSYLSEPQAQNRAGGHFFLSNSANIPPNNGSILLNSLPCTSIHMKPSTTPSSLTNVVTNNQSHLSELTILERMPFAKAKLNPSAPRRWICVSIGYTTVNARNNLKFTGNPANSIMLIMDETSFSQAPSKYSPGFSYSLYSFRNVTNPAEKSGCKPSSLSTVIDLARV